MAELRDQLQATLGQGYGIERELGGGGMSRVFLATETRFGRRVVVKVLRSEIAGATSGERFEREISLSARCQHPHIVPLLTAGMVAGLPYFTMPFVEGESLRDLLERGGPLPVEQVVRLLTEIADALAYAHRQGIIHRDIKPENILLQDGHALVADFGVAKALSAATRAERSPSATGVGVIIGTPAYMSPEQALGDAGVDHRADLYAMGILGYELLTGKTPFGAGASSVLLSAQLSRTPPSVIRVRTDCPPALAALLEHLLAKDPAARPPSAEAVREELQAIGRGTADAAARKRRGRVVLVAGTTLAVAAVLFAALTRRSAAPGANSSAAPAVVKSLAVLPFQNLGGDSTTDYFGAGIAEELISALGRLEGLRVASRTSAFAARARSTDLREIGRRLNVGAVLEGTVQQSGQRVKVTARLVDVLSDAQVWDGEYRGELRDVFAVQDTIAHAIAAALRITLTGREGTALVARATNDLGAHDEYLRGRFFLAFRNPVAVRKAIAAFQSAVQRDSNYALAYAGLADAYSLSVPFSGFTPAEALPRAKAAALRALALDSTSSEVHTALGIIAMFYDANWREAEHHLTRALELNPNNAQGHLFRAWSLQLTGRQSDGYAEILKARTLDPLSLIINTRVGSMLHYVGREHDAVTAFQRALQIDSTFAQARAGLAISYVALGRYQEALALRTPVETMLGNYEAGEWGVVFAKAGQTAEARRLLAELEGYRMQRYVSADALAAIHVALGEADPAFAELERALHEHAFALVISRVEPLFESLHRDPRWERFMTRLGFPAGSGAK